VADLEVQIRQVVVAGRARGAPVAGDGGWDHKAGLRAQGGREGGREGASGCAGAGASWPGLRRGRGIQGCRVRPRGPCGGRYAARAGRPSGASASGTCTLPAKPILVYPVPQSITTAGLAAGSMAADAGLEPQGGLQTFARLRGPHRGPGPPSMIGARLLAICGVLNARASSSFDRTRAEASERAQPTFGSRLWWPSF
jgi:hypothetical protein